MSDNQKHPVMTLVDFASDAVGDTLVKLHAHLDLYDHMLSKAQELVDCEDDDRLREMRQALAVFKDAVSAYQVDMVHLDI